MTVDLTYCGSNSDITKPLVSGEITPKGIDLTAFTEYPPRRHRRFFRQDEFDICEVSLASYLSSRESPEQYPFTAIPVFPSKRFRHSFFYKHADADIDGPADLENKKVGVQSWQTTANVWVRGIAQEHYGLDLESVSWYRRKEDDVVIEIPDRFDIQRVSEDKVEKADDMQELLFNGDLDAAMDPSGSLFHAVAKSDSAELMFDDPLAEEKRYFEETGIHPPMHTVAIRDEVLEENSWVAENMVNAFCEARNRVIDRNTSPSVHMSLTWGHLLQLEQKQILGEEMWDYGLTERNKRSLEKLIEYADNQGLVSRKFAPEELFIDSVL